MISSTLIISAFCLNAAFCLASPTPYKAWDFNQHEEAIVRRSEQTERVPLPLVPVQPQLREDKTPISAELPAKLPASTYVPLKGESLHYVLSTGKGFYGYDVANGPEAELLILECELSKADGTVVPKQCPGTIGADFNILAKLFYVSVIPPKGPYHIAEKHIEQAFVSGIENANKKTLTDMNIKKFIRNKVVIGELTNYRDAKDVIMKTPIPQPQSNDPRLAIPMISPQWVQDAIKNLEANKIILTAPTADNE